VAGIGSRRADFELHRLLTGLPLGPRLGRFRLHGFKHTMESSLAFTVQPFPLRLPPGVWKDLADRRSRPSQEGLLVVGRNASTVHIKSPSVHRPCSRQTVVRRQSTRLLVKGSGGMEASPGSRMGLAKRSRSASYASRRPMPVRLNSPSPEDKLVESREDLFDADTIRSRLVSRQRGSLPPSPDGIGPSFPTASQGILPTVQGRGFQHGRRKVPENRRSPNPDGLSIAMAALSAPVDSLASFSASVTLSATPELVPPVGRHTQSALRDASQLLLSIQTSQEPPSPFELGHEFETVPGSPSAWGASES
jgi:hypothetical protein